jgi:hypothetical protein
VTETPARFERRSGERYAPPAWLRAEARTLGPREACPTLFRYPGPEGLRTLLGGGLERLAPGESATLWLSARPGHERRRAARLFGAAAVLEPLRLQPCATRRRGVYLGVNRRLRAGIAVVWLPPSALGAAIPWDRIRNAEQAERRFGRGYADERARVADALGAYLEEIDSLARAGVPQPRGAWYAQSRRERVARLRAAGLAPRWTRC